MAVSFDDLIPKNASGGISFDDLTPQAAAAPQQSFSQQSASYTAGNPEGVALPKTPSGLVNTVAQKTSEVLTDPRSMFGLRQLEQGKDAVKGAVQGVISDVVRSPNNMNPAVRATLGTAASMATDVAPFSPTEMASTVVGPLMGGGQAKSLAAKGDEFANRYMETPNSVGLPRLNKGEQPLGQETLHSIPEFEGGPATKAYAQAKQLLNETETKVRELLSKLKSDATTPDAPVQGPQNKPLALEYNPGTKTVIQLPNEIPSSSGAIPLREGPQDAVRWTGEYGESSSGLAQKKTPQVVGEYGTTPVERGATSENYVLDEFGVPVKKKTSVDPNLGYRGSEGGTRRIEGEASYTMQPERDALGAPMQENTPPDPLGGPWIPKGGTRQIEPTPFMPESVGQTTTPKIGSGLRELGKEVPSNPYPKKGPVLDLKVARDAVEELAQSKEADGLASAARQIRSWAKNYFDKKPDFVDMEAGRVIRSNLDTNTPHDVERMAPVAEAMLKTADNFRGQLAKNSPELAALMRREKNLIDIMENFQNKAQKGYASTGWNWRKPVESVPKLRSNWGAAQAAKEGADFINNPRGQAEYSAGGASLQKPFSQAIEDRRKKERGQR